ncbi:MAG: hypothetical protein CM1200mP13_11210 [Candidatus Pelagibacterales bacterium]|nr:MAG: hypothetical protein CM1200mP13_11210 [Pelagibacterales bacterium]
MEQLNLNTNKISKFLKKINIKKGDRVAPYIPNTIETVEASLHNFFGRYLVFL